MNERRAHQPLWVTVAVLGLVTNVAYGVAYYSFGVLIDPIRADTHWSAAGLGVTFSAVLVIGGMGGLVGGRLVDRVGARPAFVIAAVLGSAGVAASSLATALLGFAAPYAVGCGTIAALGFYQITQPTAVRAGGQDPQRPVIWLTIIGAFSSPVFLPLTAWLAHEVGWRDTLRVEAAVNLVTFLVAAALTRAGRAGGAPARASRHEAREALRGAWRVAAFRRWVIASVISGAAIDILLVNQVPAMIAAGLSTGAAATIGGLRGLSQLAGRVPMSPLLRRLGARRTVIATFLLGVVGAILLQFSGQIAPAILYSVCAGASIGAVFTLQGIYTHELIGVADLGLVMGAQQAVFAVGGAIGPAVAGVLLQTTGSYTVIITLTAVCFAVAAATIAAGGRASPSVPERRAGQANQPASSSSASGST